MKTFNIKEAKRRGLSALVYRNGEKPQEVFYSTKSILYPIITVGPDEDITTHGSNGNCFEGGSKSDYDLMLEDEEMYVVAHKDSEDICYEIFTNIYLAKKSASTLPYGKIYKLIEIKP